MKWIRLAAFAISGPLSVIPIAIAAKIMLSSGPIIFGCDPQVWITNDFGEITVETFRGRDFGKDHQTLFLPPPFRSSLSVFLLSLIPFVVWLYFMIRTLQKGKSILDLRTC